MMSGRVIDLDEEFSTLLKKEKIFAFFDFSLSLPGDQTASGLCKISRPKSADSKSHYISLLFMVDAADDPKSRSINEHMNGIDWGELNKSVVEVTSVLPMPSLSQRAGIYIREVDIYLGGDNFERLFFEKLIVSLARVAGLNAETPVFWDDFPRAEEPATGSEPSEPEHALSYRERLRKFMGKQ
jgi:hypothetical protein